MNLTPETAERIAAGYGKLYLNCGGNHNFLEAALAEVMRRHGGLFAVLTDEARRDLILTLGKDRRATHRRNVQNRARYAAERAAFAAAQAKFTTPLAAE